MLQAETDSKPRSSRGPVALVVLALLLVAVAANIYLGHLYVEVHSKGAGEVQAWCDLGKSANCITVATSRYAVLWGMPMAFLGAEYYGLAALIVLLSLAGVRSLRRWESLVLWTMLAALPVSLVMAYFAIFRVRSLCIMCCSVYTANVLVLLLLSVTRRRELGALLRCAGRDLRTALRSPGARLTATLIVVLGVSQLLWVPQLLSANRGPQNPSNTAAHESDFLDGAGLEIGPRSAPVKIVEYSDFECGMCSRAHLLMIQLLHRYQGRIHFEHRDYPLDQTCNRSIDRPFHEVSCQAAYYARCAAKQGRFWRFAGLLFANQHDLGLSDLQQYAAAAGLSWPALQACVANGDVQQAVLADVEAGIRLNIRGTPTFLINGKEVVLGAHDLAWWDAKIAQLSGSAGATSADGAATAADAQP